MKKNMSSFDNNAVNYMQLIKITIRLLLFNKYYTNYFDTIWQKGAQWQNKSVRMDSVKLMRWKKYLYLSTNVVIFHFIMDSS